MKAHARSILATVTAVLLAASSTTAATLEESFANPPDSARPWVYWYFMDGNTTREGMKADLDAMKAAGIGGVLILEIGAGRPPRGPVEFLSPKWLELFGYAIAEADRLGIEVAVGTGPGWCGAGGKSVKPDDAMQHTVASETTVTGPLDYSSVLPIPAPRAPFFGVRTLTSELRKEWESYYRDVAVLAFPEPEGAERLPDADEKAIYQRAPFSSRPGVKPYLPTSHKAVPPEKCVDPAKVVDLTAKMDASGRLTWRVPEGRWTILRVGRRLTGQTTRPAPKPGLGFETSKFDRGAIERHLHDYADKILAAAGPRRPGRGLTTLHFDSWEMSAQNGSAEFFKEFERRRGYSPLPYIPAINGRVVRSTEVTERFLFDWRQTAQELVIENQLLPIKRYAHGKGLVMSSEPYDMNPCCDITSGAVADIPMCEFWSKGMGFNTAYSCLEAVSVAHTMGRPVVGAEAFTASAEYWRQYPGSMKAQGDWALAFGINCFKFHTYQHQPSLTDKPGMTMCGYYGVNWHRNQTWWPMVDSYHRYLTRCQMMLRAGRPVSDILYLLPEGAPMVFQPPKDAFMDGDFPDRKGYSFDGCSPEVFMSRAKFVDGKIDFEGGATYSVLVLPKVDAMTPALMKKILECAEAGVRIVGGVPRKSPSLSGYPKCDEDVATLAEHIANVRSRANGRDARPARPWASGTLAPTVADIALDELEHSAKWIWSVGERDVMKQPNGSRWFKKTFTIDDVSQVDGAAVVITVDNAYRLYVNGKCVGDGIDFHDIGQYDVKEMLKSGNNVLEVLADNWDDTPNPAGLIAACAIKYAAGRSETVITDATWTYTRNRDRLDEKDAPVQEFGGYSMGPWRLRPQPRALYESYASTAKLLSTAGLLSPDFETTGDLRYIHRRLDGQDLYFVGNRLDTPQTATCRFRVGGVKSVEWWNPLNGERTALKDWECADGVVKVELTLGPGESGFAMLRKEPPYTSKRQQAYNNKKTAGDLGCDGTPRASQRQQAYNNKKTAGDLGCDGTPCMSQGQQAYNNKKTAGDLGCDGTPCTSQRQQAYNNKMTAGYLGCDGTPRAAKRQQAYNNKKVASGKTVEGPWKVSFDPAWGGPESEVEFKTLEDWTKRPEWGISHYSGIATYRKMVTSKEAPTHISLGDVANLARVKLNGKDLGSVWCWPWRVAVPEGVWKDGENLLEIEVANLWANRLIGDASLPAEKRLTRTTVNPHKPGDPLRRSGLFGPVCLER